MLADMGKIIAFIPSFALMIGEGALQISGYTNPHLAYLMGIAAVVLFIIPCVYYGRQLIPNIKTTKSTSEIPLTDQEEEEEEKASRKREMELEFQRFKEQKMADLRDGLSAEHRSLAKKDLDRLEQMFFEVELHDSGYLPINYIVSHVAKRIEDTDEEYCYPDTLQTIRQEASNGNLRIRGKKQLNTQETRFSDIHTDIPKEYWEKSVINSLATSIAYMGDTHTNPETAFAWGEKGVYEPNRYADLQVEWEDVRRIWP